MKLSIIIPVFNEEKTVVKTVEKVLAVKIFDIEKEIIIVDDGSTDNSKFKIQNSKLNGIKLISHEKNLGKGAAVRTGIKNATGDYILIQDADLEYNPRYISELFRPIQKKEAEIVYGTRLDRLPHLSGEEKGFRFFLHYIGNRSLSLIMSVLYGQWITDMETCYKLFPKKAVERVNLKSKSFDFEPEITAKLMKQGYSIKEVRITTVPRGYKEGKKLNTFRDGIVAFFTIIKYRFVD